MTYAYDLDYPIAHYSVVCFEGPQRPELNHLFIQAWDDFVAKWGSDLRWFVKANGRWRAFDKKAAAFPRKRYWDNFEEALRAWQAHAGATETAPTELGIYCQIRSEGALPGLPLNCVLQRVEPVAEASPTEVLAEVLARFSNTPFLHGYAGVGTGDVLGATSQAQQRVRRSHLALRRYLGLDCCAADLELDGGEGMRPPAWLTLLGNAWLARIGGREALAAFPSEVIIHELGTGVAIQAGETPTLGDQNRGEDVPLLRIVNRLLRPLRYNQGGFAGEPFPAFARDWYARLDAPPGMPWTSVNEP